MLTYWGLAFYNLTAALHTLTYARSGGAATLLDRLPRPLQALHAFYHTTVTTYPFIVTAVYWGVLYGGGWFGHDVFAAWSNTSQHALNSGFALFEILLTRAPPAPWVHAPWLVVVLALYLSLAYLTHYTKGFYTYSFLDIQAQGSAITAAWIVAIAVAGVVVYCVVRGLVVVRLWLTESVAGLDGKFAGGGGGQRSRPSAAVALGSVVDDVEMGRYRNDDNKSSSPVSVTESHDF